MPDNLEHTTDIEQFFSYDNKARTLTFKGQKLVAYVPRRMEIYGFLSVSEKVTSVGIMDLVINDKYSAHLNLMAQIETEPSDVSYQTRDGKDQCVFTYFTGDKFLANTVIVKQQALIYAIWSEFIGLGNLPSAFSYQELSRLFDNSKSLCDASLPVDHAMLDVIYAHACRDQNDRSIPYRHTDMKTPFYFTPMKSVSGAPDSTTARLLGSHFEEGLIASMISESDSRQQFEDILRGMPTQEE